jgi:hypothetical protein
VTGEWVLVTIRNYTVEGWTRETIYIDVEGDASVLQEIAFTAPHDKYSAYRNDAQKAFASVRIKSPSR